MDSSTHPPVVFRLHYLFDGWRGDELLESFPCFIVTKALGDALLVNGLTGFEFGEVEIEINPDVRDELPGELPEFYWLKITGEIPKNDFGRAPDLRLALSQRALGISNQFTLKNALIEEL